MAQLFLFGLHWSHAGNLYYDAVLTGEKDELINYFNQHKRSDVTLVKSSSLAPKTCLLSNTYSAQLEL